MNPPYYDRLQTIIEQAKWIQGQPIPDSEVAREINLMRLANVEHEIGCIVLSLAPEVWVGDPNDYLRGDRPMAPGLEDTRTLTSEEARSLLAPSNANRPLKQETVESYTRNFKAGLHVEKE